MNPKTDAQQPKPRVAFAIATALGAGYLPKAPGTFGSLVGVLLFCIVRVVAGAPPNYLLLLVGALTILTSALGVWAAGRVESCVQKKDPQIVVIDEVAGQLITYLGFGYIASAALNWQYLLAGFILFRVFDIWKPFPIRRAESLPGGLGIMADDWIAGLYAALVLALARHFGL
jgi:phosphatidylglycerophosphatase A